MADSFRLDMTAFHMCTQEETERYHARNQPATFADRLKAAAYLNSTAFRYDVNTPPRWTALLFQLENTKMADLFKVDF